MTDNTDKQSDIRNSLAAKLQLARRAAGLSTRRASDAMESSERLSHTTICKYEKGTTSPPLEVLAVLAKLYKCPIEWFVQRGETLTNVRYHDLPNKPSLAKRLAYEAEVNRWLDSYVAIEDHLEIPLPSDLSEMRAQPGETPTELATRVRAEFGLNGDPVPSVMQLLEKFGVRTIEQPTDLKVGGLAAKYGNEHVVALNPEADQARSRLNAAHELGHILFGDCDGDSAPIEAKTSHRRAIEFAAHVLLPDKWLQEAFKTLSVVRLLRFEEQFGIPHSAMIDCAQTNHLITAAQANLLWIELDKRSWTSPEPSTLRRERATRFEELLDNAILEKRFTLRRAATIACVQPQELQTRLARAMEIN